MDQRTRTLLLDTGNHFENGVPPLNHDWLVENDVGIDEMTQLGTVLGSVIKGYANAPQELRTLILLCGTADDPGQAQMMIAKLTESMALQTVINRLKKM